VRALARPIDGSRAKARAAQPDHRPGRHE
jgi:hypothetical protein